MTTVDLSISTDGTGLYSEGKNKIEITQSGTLKQTITVTNHSNETATGIVAAADLQAGLDVWEPHQSHTEHGTDWIGSQGAENKAKFYGDPTTIDPTHGTVTVNDEPLVGIDPKKIDTKLYDLPQGELIWELGTPLAPGESATLTYYAQRTPYNTGGVEFHQDVSIKHIDQHDSNPHNNYHKVDLKFGTPLVLDLDGDGIQTLSIDEGVEFDILNTGEAKVQTGWIGGDDALLAIDNNGNGIIDDRSELFGGEIGEGFAQLAGFDSNGDGLVDSSDAGFSDLQVWQDANENALTDAGELLSLDSAGVAALGTAYTNVFSTDAQGNIHGEHGLATLADGSSIDLVDIYFQVEG